jgi:hypothetical protein
MKKAAHEVGLEELARPTLPPTGLAAWRTA